MFLGRMSTSTVTTRLRSSWLSLGLAGLSMALQAICQVKYFHVHSHEWQPWNELADSLAKVAALLDVMPEVPPLHCLLDLGLAD